MSRPHILIVEDDRSLADILDYNLGREGYEMSVARDGLSGLNEARLKLPDLIVLDLMLPVIDGMEICRRLRDDPSTKHILVLMLTAKSEEMDQVAGFVAGADDYVTKPFSVAVVLERIRALLNVICNINILRTPPSEIKSHPQIRKSKITSLSQQSNLLLKIHFQYQHMLHKNKIILPPK